MEKFWTSLTIVRHSLDIMRRHPRLLLFPVLSLAAALLIYAFVLAPQLLDKTVAEIWYALRDPDQGLQSIGPWHAADNGGSLFSHISIAGYIAYYLLAMFVVTFLNVALYSQIIAAMNGGRVSVARAFALACSRLPAIFGWSLLASTIGVVIRVIQERSGFLMKGIAALAGVSWMAASVFVIPVMINEPRPRSPFEYLNISGALIKRVWGEGIIAISGVGLVAALLFVPLLFLNLALSVTLGPSDVTMAIVLASVVMAMLVSLAYQIFECGLYVYATEGVAPGTFDEEIFDRVWTFKRGAAQAAERRAIRRTYSAWLWIIVPVAICCGSVMWMNFYMRPAPQPPHPAIRPAFDTFAIDLGSLDYVFDLKDLQAVGLFAGRTCPRCNFSVTGTWVLMGGKVDERLQVIARRMHDRLYLGFSGVKDADNEARVAHIIEALQSRFPGHENAISLVVGKIPYVPRTTVAAWNPLPSAVSYTLEIDCMLCCGRNKWCADMGQKWKIVPDLHATTYSFDWVGAQPGRWRVWAIDHKGHSTYKSAWTYFDYSW